MASSGRNEGRAGMPRWVKVSAIAVSIFAILLAILLIFGGGQHGPSRHFGGLSGAANGVSVR